MHFKLLVDHSGQPGNTCGFTAEGGRLHLHWLVRGETTYMYLPNQRKITYDTDCSTILVSQEADHLLLSQLAHETLQLTAFGMFI